MFTAFNSMGATATAMLPETCSHCRQVRDAESSSYAIKGAIMLIDGQSACLVQFGTMLLCLSSCGMHAGTLKSFAVATVQHHHQGTATFELSSLTAGLSAIEIMSQITGEVRTVRWKQNEGHGMGIWLQDCKAI